MGRSPCCYKAGLKKGPWTPEEDQKLLAFIDEHGHGSWRALPAKAGLQRCGKSCRLRWINYLRPDIKRGKFTLQEEQTIIQLHALLGNRWSAIATHLPKRTDNEIKNYWNTHLKKRLAKMGIDPVTHKPKLDALVISTDGHSKSAANLSHMAQWESARLEAEARLVRESKLRSNSVLLPAHLAAADHPTGPISTQLLNKTAGIHIGGDHDLESPSSTLTKEEVHNQQNHWISSFTSSTLHDTTLMPLEAALSWSTTSSNDHQHVQVRDLFVEDQSEGFTNLLLNNCDDRSLSNCGGESENGSGGGGDSGGAARNNDYYDDNKNYWSSILNSVNSPVPSDSSIF